MFATETPIAAPMPEDPPPIPTATPTTTEEISDVDAALTTTSPALTRTLSSAKARVLLRITFCEMAPAPATARPSARTPMLRAREAAAETALIVAAVTPNFPDVGSNARTNPAGSHWK